MSGRGRRNFGKSDGLTCILGRGEDRPSRPGARFDEFLFTSVSSLIDLRNTDFH